MKALAGDRSWGRIAPHVYAVALLPTLGIALAVAVFVMLAHEGAMTRTAAWALSGAALGGGLVAQLLAARRLIERIRRPVTSLATSLQARRGPSSAAADWEVATVHVAARGLLREAAADRRDAERLRRAIPAITDVAAVLDRIATDEPGGDAAHCEDFLEPIGDSLRALMERLDRREHELALLFEQLGRAVQRLGGEAASSAAAREGAFFSLLEAISTLKDARAAIDSITREISNAGGGADRVVGMIDQLAQRLEHCLHATGAVSSGLEAEASRDRRIAAQGTGLRMEVEGVRRKVERSARPRPLLSRR